MSGFGNRRILRLVLLLEMIVLAGIAIGISRDYQDSWVLEGLEIPFAIFIVTHIVYFLVESDNKWLVIFATISRFAIFLLPVLKYRWFLGTAVDQHLQLRATRFVSENGYIESGKTIYSETPIMHVFFAMFSKVTDVSVLDSFKYLPVISWFIYPFIIYSVIKKIVPEYGKSSIVKWALLISSMPITPYLSFTVTGSVFGSLLALLLLSEFLKVLQTSSRKHLALAIFFSLTLVMTHFVSSILLMIGLFMVFLADKFLKISQSTLFSMSFPIFLVALNSAWILAQLNNATIFVGTFENVIRNFVRGLLGLQVVGWSPTGVRLRLFELGFLDQSRVLTVFNGGDIIVLLLALLGVILSRKALTSKPLKFLCFYFVSLWLFVFFQLLLTFGEAALMQYHRVIRHTLIICPLLGAFSLHYIDKGIRRGKIIIAAIVLSIALLNTIETFGYQPMLPSSSAIADTLPQDEPVVHLNWMGVNSIYQRSKIQHVERYVPSGIQLASDRVTENQIVGLGHYDFSDTQLTKYNPLLRLVDQDLRRGDYDLFLIHLPGRAGVLAEEAEARTRKLILRTVMCSAVLYTNGESFVLIYTEK